MKCKTPGCDNIAIKNRLVCGKCRSRQYRKEHPLKSAFAIFRCNARRRGKVFELTFDQFKKFAVETDYYIKKGKKAKSYHIDRIDESKGYTIDNIQVLTNSQNVKKYLDYQKNGNETTFKVITSKPVEIPPGYKQADKPNFYKSKFGQFAIITVKLKKTMP